MARELKPGDTWGCPAPGCSRHVKLNAGLELAFHKRDGQRCPGSGFGPMRPAYAEMIRTLGKEFADANMRASHPGWQPPDSQ
ncbi:hypothetical protein [Streptomyces sp. cg35]|uniref:hypothetical protein n=1 Tax=Streptomyces sp. cg35 TaxID=3421650 RepID=UPI003D16C050